MRKPESVYRFRLFYLGSEGCTVIIHTIVLSKTLHSGVSKPSTLYLREDIAQIRFFIKLPALKMQVVAPYTGIGMLLL